MRSFVFGAIVAVACAEYQYGLQHYEHGDVSARHYVAPLDESHADYSHEYRHDDYSRPIGHQDYREVIQDSDSHYQSHERKHDDYRHY